MYFWKVLFISVNLCTTHLLCKKKEKDFNNLLPLEKMLNGNKCVLEAQVSTETENVTFIHSSFSISISTQCEEGCRGSELKGRGGSLYQAVKE